MIVEYCFCLVKQDSMSLQYSDYEDYLEIFGGDAKLHKKVSSSFNEAFRAIEKKKCLHQKKTLFPDGKGYCNDCGISISDKTTLDGECPHENTYEDDNGLHLCMDCNEEISIPDDEPEWRYYYSSDNRTTKDPARCHRGRPKGHSLAAIFANIDISPAIAAQVEKDYSKIVGKSTVRGDGRLAIVAACLFHTYPKFGEFRTSDHIRQMFNLNKKSMSDGLTRYAEAFPKARNSSIRPEELIRWIMTMTGVDQAHYKKIVQIARYLEKSSRLLERSSPQSVASAIIYFYLCLYPDYKRQLGLTKNKFAEQASLSDITVTKLVKEASAIGKCAIEM